MQERIQQQRFYQLQPQLPQALIALGKSASASTLEAKLIHLVKIRASQINGCGFCLHMHHAEARKDGESQERLDILLAWREVPYFNERERAALAWTEALTLIAQQSVSDQLYDTVTSQFNETELANLTATIIEINGWNRIVAGFHFVPKLDQIP